MLPEPLATALADGGYLPRGVPLLKRVFALSGQTVCRLGLQITVDGVAAEPARERNLRGRPLPVWQGCRVIAADELFLMNWDESDSLDGRYFGPTLRSAIVARAVPVWTDEAGDGRFAWCATRQ
jgi:type IV secretory pathway protease TraF